MSDRPRPIIIKKVYKKHQAHHGGSWKVAYADFVTALMAFFLLLWLLTMVSPEKRAALSDYFNNFSIWKESGASFSKGQGGTPAFSQTAINRVKDASSADRLKDKLKGAVEEKMKALENQIAIDVIEGGVRVQIMDTEGSLMFPIGSAQPTDKAVKLLGLVAENIKEMPNKIAVEGHTDSVPFKSEQTTNWELATSRASAARRELEKGGIDIGRIARVVGYADQDLYIKDNPKDARNRRISIIVLPTALKERPFASETGIPTIQNRLPAILPSQTFEPAQNVRTRQDVQSFVGDK
jgi:chemotaxis protein MotB